MNLDIRTVINTTLMVTCLIIIVVYFIDVQALQKIAVLFNVRSEYNFPKQVWFCPLAGFLCRVQIIWLE